MRAGDFIIREGDSGLNVYFILDGAAQVVSADGKVIFNKSGQKYIHHWSFNEDTKVKSTAQHRGYLEVSQLQVLCDYSKSQAIDMVNVSKIGDVPPLQQLAVEPFVFSTDEFRGCDHIDRDRSP